MKTWIITAQQAEARIYEHRKSGEGIRLIDTVRNEKGRLKDGEINTDRAGVSGDHQGQHGLQTKETPHQRVAADFARKLASRLEQERVHGSFDSLFLVAAPKMLGLLRSTLDAPTTALLKGSLDKEFHESDQAHLETALQPFFRL